MPERHALVIEDQEILRDMLSRSLEPLGYSVEAVRTLPAGDAALRVNAPDVLVLDGRIRGVDVPTWLGGVRPLLPGVPFVVLTGLGANLHELPHALGPCTSILPLVGSIILLISRIVVVLPQPDGPISTHTSPAGTVSVM